ncbi:proteasome component M29 [Elasticomyces elasticus]|nr:proteasome component M29 [Elasticomyces elasticus]
MATSGLSPEARELSLVGKVEMRIALADSDAKLESTLKTYLAPLLLKLASEHVSVRNKLPVTALLKQFKEQSETPLIRHFDLLYIQQGVRRLPTNDRIELLPLLIQGITQHAAGSVTHGSQLFNLLLQLLPHFKLPPRGSKEDSEIRSTLAVSEEDVQFLAHWFGRVILLTPSRSQHSPQANGLQQSCPGLMAEEYTFLTVQNKDDVWNPLSSAGLNITEVKIAVAKFVASALFSDAQRLLPALFASAEPNSTVSELGEDTLKRAIAGSVLDDETLVEHLYDMYFGDDQPGGLVRVRPPLRLRIVILLTRTAASTKFPHRIIRLVEDTLVVNRSATTDVLAPYDHQSNNQVSLGREAAKMRAAAFAFINFVTKYGAQADLFVIAPKVVTKLRDFIEDQGWPRAANTDDLSSRGLAYEIVGLLAKAGPKELLLEPNLELLRWLFHSLAGDISRNLVTVSIEEALSTVMGVFNDLTDPDLQWSLTNLLLNQMLESRKALLSQDFNRKSTAFVAVRFVNRSLPYDSVQARWIDILAVGGVPGERQEISEEGRKGLSPYWHRTLNLNNITAELASPPRFPVFTDLINYMFYQTDPEGYRLSDEASMETAVARFAENFPAAFGPAVRFCRQLLLSEAFGAHNIHPKIDDEWERKIDALIDSDEDARNAARQAVKAKAGAAPSLKAMKILLLALFKGLQQDRDQTAQHSMVARGNDQLFVELCALSPDQLVAEVALYYNTLDTAICSNNAPRRIAAAHAFGLLASHPKTQSSADQQLKIVIGELLDKTCSWKTAFGAEVNRVHGATMSLAYYLSRLSFRKQTNLKLNDTFKRYLGAVLDMLVSSNDKLLQEAGYSAIGQLCLFNLVAPSDISECQEITLVVDKIAHIAKTGNGRAIVSLGMLAMIAQEPENGTEDTLLHYIQDQLQKLHEIRQAEAHFSVGEAFTYLACGWQSKALAATLDVEGQPPKGPSREKSLGRILDKVVSDCANTKPALRKASVIWLLCIVQYCGHLTGVQERLAKCQAAFKRCLSDRDDLIQETASRGLGLIYEKGDRRLKDDLVRDLVSSFSGNNAQLAGSVTEDTQLFEPGALPTGEGSVTTYKDIMSLASEVGDSSLVYRFMSLASSNAIWSSRAAFGRFGLSNVLSDSSVDGYLAENPKLYPKLYRYRFDPNSGVQRSMNDIWNALVKDSSATIEKHFDAIIQDLLQNVLGKEWRVRQACCAAIADLIQSRPLEKYESYLERIWDSCFKVLDDIKESVRAAAASLARVMTGILTRALEADQSSSKNAVTMLKHVLPFLLSTSGLESSAQEVQAFALHTLLEIIKKANGKTLRPFIPELVERLLGLLSSLEPQAVNYIHLNASKYNLTEQKIDDMRLSSVRGSPLMEAIERCLDLLDDDSMAQLRPRLETAMKTAVGLPSKVGCSRVLVSLSTRHNALFRPYSDAFLKLIEKQVLDRNETISSSYAVAAGYVARLASDKQILQLVKFAKGLYFQSEGDRDRSVPSRSITSGEIMYAISKYAADRFSALGADIIPFIFVAKHDSNELVKEPFQNAWTDSVGGPRAVLLYLREIIDIALGHLESAQWILKHTAARTIADATLAVAASGSEMSVANAQILWPALEKALSGKTWEGKEHVLQAFVRFVETGGQLWKTQPAIADKITQIIVREAKRQNPAYRQHAIRSLGSVAAARPDIDMMDVVFDIVGPVLESELEAAADGSAMQVDGGEDAMKAEQMQERFAASSARILRLAVRVRDSSIGMGSNAVQSTIYDALSKWLIKTKTASVGRAEKQEIGKQLHTLLFGPGDGGVEAVRAKRSEAIQALADSAFAAADAGQHH